MTACACGSGAQASTCCAPLHEGRAEAANAEQLMRSRFAAFKLGKAGYLWHTLHRDHDEKVGDPNAYAEHLRAGLRGLVYKELRVLDRDGPDADGIARVLFRATVLSHGRDVSFVELSSFANGGDGWRYLFGVPVEAKQFQTDTSRLTIARVAG